MCLSSPTTMFCLCLPGRQNIKFKIIFPLHWQRSDHHFTGKPFMVSNGYHLSLVHLQKKVLEVFSAQVVQEDTTMCLKNWDDKRLILKWVLSLNIVHIQYTLLSYLRILVYFENPLLTPSLLSIFRYKLYYHSGQLFVLRSNAKYCIVQSVSLTVSIVICQPR